jgi:hypothetical protein
VFHYRRRTKLRWCPVCAAESVSAWRSDDVGDGVRARVRLRCAECQTWRELVATVWAVDAYERRLERQRSQIEAALLRLEHDRRVAETRAFIAELRRTRTDTRQLG